MPDDAQKYTIRDDYDPDDEMPTDTDPFDAYQTYVDDRDAGYGDIGVYAGRLRAVHRGDAAAREATTPKEQGYRLFQTVAPKPWNQTGKAPAIWL